MTLNSEGYRALEVILQHPAGSYSAGVTEEGGGGGPYVEIHFTYADTFANGPPFLHPTKGRHIYFS